MSVLVVSCSNCGQQFGIPAGKQAACPKCMTINRLAGPTPGVLLSPALGPVAGIALGAAQPWLGGLPGTYGYSSPPGTGPPFAQHLSPGFGGPAAHGPSFGVGGFVSPQGAGPLNPYVAPGSPVSPYAGIMPASPAPALSLPSAGVAMASSVKPVTPVISRVQLAFSGHNLTKHSSLMITVEDRNGVLAEFKNEPFSTEVVFDNKNPVWVRKLEVPKQDDIKLSFVVFEKDKRYGVLGGTPVSEILEAMPWRKPLQDPKTGYRLPTAAISARWEDISSGGDTVEFEAAATALRSYDSNGLSDPFMQIFRGEASGIVLVHQTEVVPKCLSPTWKPFSLRLSQLTGSLLVSASTTQTTPIVFKLFDWNTSGRSNFMGEYKTTVAALIADQNSCGGVPPRYRLSKEKDKKKVERGVIVINKFRVSSPPAAVSFPPFSSAALPASPQQLSPTPIVMSPGFSPASYNSGPTQGVLLPSSIYSPGVSQPPPEMGYEAPPPAYQGEEFGQAEHIAVATPALHHQFSQEPPLSSPAAQEGEWEAIPPELLVERSPEEVIFEQQQQAMRVAQEQQYIQQQQMLQLQQQQQQILVEQQQILVEQQQQQQLSLIQQQQQQQQQQQLRQEQQQQEEFEALSLGGDEQASPVVAEAPIPLPDGPIVTPAPIPLPFEAPPAAFDQPPEPYFVVPPEDRPPVVPEEVRRPPPAARGAPPPARGAPPPARGAPPPARGGPSPQGNYPFDPSFRGGLASSRGSSSPFSVDHVHIHHLIFIMSTPPALQYLATVCDAPFRSTLHRPSVERLTTLLGQGQHLEWDAIPFDLKDQVPNLLKTWVSASDFRFGQDRHSDLNMALVCRAIISTGKYYKTFDSMSIAFTALNDLGGVYQASFEVSG